MSERTKKLKYFFGWKEMITKPIPTQLKRQTSLIYTYNKINQTLNKNKEKQKTTMSSSNAVAHMVSSVVETFGDRAPEMVEQFSSVLGGAKSLAEVRQEIEDEIEWVDIKPYSHNIISAHLMGVNRVWGQEAANDIIMDLDLENLGWNTVETEDEEPVKKKKATKKKKLVLVAPKRWFSILENEKERWQEFISDVQVEAFGKEPTDTHPILPAFRLFLAMKQEEEDSDAEYNRRCENGEAKCEDCGKWGQALDMDYDDDTGFHVCCGDEYDGIPYANEGATYEDL